MSNLTVTPFERLRYHVGSRSKGGAHLVDIGSFRINGSCNGKCDCLHFQTKLMPALRTAYLANPKSFKPQDDYRCAHLIAARKQAFDELLDLSSLYFARCFDDYDGDEELAQLTESSPASPSASSTV